MIRKGGHASILFVLSIEIAHVINVKKTQDWVQYCPILDLDAQSSELNIQILPADDRAAAQTEKIMDAYTDVLRLADNMVKAMCLNDNVRAIRIGTKTSAADFVNWFKVAYPMEYPTEEVNEAMAAVKDKNHLFSKLVLHFSTGKAILKRCVDQLAQRVANESIKADIRTFAHKLDEFVTAYGRPEKFQKVAFIVGCSVELPVAFQSDLFALDLHWKQIESAASEEFY